MKKTIIIIWLALIASLIFIPIVLAADTNTPIVPENIDVGELFKLEGEKPKYLDTKENTPLIAAVLDVINIAMYFIGSVAILAIIIGGLVMITGYGNENQIQKGKTIFLYAIIGLLVALSAYIISTFVQSTFF